MHIPWPWQFGRDTLEIAKAIQSKNVEQLVLVWKLHSLPWWAVKEWNGGVDPGTFSCMISWDFCRCRCYCCRAQPFWMQFPVWHRRFRDESQTKVDGKQSEEAEKLCTQTNREEVWILHTLDSKPKIHFAARAGFGCFGSSSALHWWDLHNTREFVAAPSFKSVWYWWRRSLWDSLERRVCGCLFDYKDIKVGLAAPLFVALSRLNGFWDGICRNYSLWMVLYQTILIHISDFIPTNKARNQWLHGNLLRFKEFAKHVPRWQIQSSTSPFN